MPANRILCSTGAFIHNWNGHDHGLISYLSPKIPYDGFEIFMFDGFHLNGRLGEYPAFADNVVESKNAGVDFYSMHAFKMIGEYISRNEPGDIELALNLFEFCCGYAVLYGVKLLVLHLWGGEPSDKNIDVNIKTYPKLKEISDRHGLTLTVENIVCNTHKPLTHMKRLWETYGGDVRFTIDVRQAEFHKSLTETCESGFLWDNGLVPHIHVSDYKGGHMEWERLRGGVPIGGGDVDFKYLFKFLKSVGFRGSLTLEHNFTMEDDGLIDYLNGAYGFIREGLGG